MDCYTSRRVVKTEELRDGGGITLINWDPSHEDEFVTKTRDQPEPGSFFPRSLWDAEMKDSGNEVGKFHVVIWQTNSKNCTKVRAALAARLYFLIQPIRSLFVGVVVAVAVVLSEAPL